MVPFVGCASQACIEFETAQRLAAQQNKDLLVFYESWASTECGEMKSRLQSPRVRQELADAVVCTLEESYEPNQRFMAQYDVDRYPALILIHRDATYHHMIGIQNEDQLVSFLSSAEPPGRPPMINPQIPRRFDYQWQADHEYASNLAKSQQRPVFIFFKSVVNADCNDMLFNDLNRADVAAHFSHTVNCMLDWGYPPNRQLMQQYGVTHVPAVVIVQPDGRYLVREGRLSAAELVGFVRQAGAMPDAAATRR